MHTPLEVNVKTMLNAVKLHGLTCASRAVVKASGDVRPKASARRAPEASFHSGLRGAPACRQGREPRTVPIEIGTGAWIKRALNSYPRKFLTGHTYTITSLIGFAMLISPSIGNYTASLAPQAVQEEGVQIAEAKGKAAGPEIYEVMVTAYSSSPEETDSTPFTTAMNTETHDGVIAANFLPFGTRVRIPALFGDKVFTVEDRMHRRKTDFVDVWMPTKEEAQHFGITRAVAEVL